MDLDIKQFVGAVIMISIGGLILSTPFRGTVAENYHWIGYVPVLIGIVYLGLLIKSAFSR